MSGAIALAISPAESNRLLLGTDSGVLRSNNGGRDWAVEAPDLLVGTAFAVTYEADGRRALASGASAVFRNDGDRWHRISTPAGAAPARALARGSAPGRVYLAGWTGFYRSDDGGLSWTDAGQGLPDEPVDVLAVALDPPEVLYAVAGGRLWASFDEGRDWQPRRPGPPSARTEAVALDDVEPTRVWALVNGQLFRSDDRGDGWQAVGRPLTEPNVAVRGMTVLGPIVLLATTRGVYRTADRGEQWAALGANLPAHLEAGVLVRDPTSASTVYAGFSLAPYAELWRQAAEGRSALSRLTATELVGSAAFLALLTLAAVAALRRLTSHYRQPPATSSHPPVAPTSETRNAP